MVGVGDEEKGRMRVERKGKAVDGGREEREQVAPSEG